MSEMKAKDRLALERHHMIEQDALARSRNFEEVNQGYTVEMAMEEAERCLRCKKPLCVDGCPVSVKIPEFIQMIADGKFHEAADILKQDNALPAVCGRVCPQEDQCEKGCILKGRFEFPLLRSSELDTEARDRILGARKDQ